MTMKADSIPATPNKSGFSQTVYLNTGFISMLGLIGLLFLVTSISHFSWSGLFGDMFVLYRSGPQALEKIQNTPVFTVVINCIATILVMVVCSMVILFVIQKVGVKGDSFRFRSIEDMLDKGPKALFASVSLEEIVSRGIFLGLLLPLFGNTMLAFWILFLSGNSIFAVVHFVNYKSKSDRKLLNVLPQFVGGIVLTYVFMRWGLFIAILAHFYYDVIIVSFIKEQKPNKSSLIIGGYYLVVITIAAIMMSANNLNLSDLGQWLTARGDLLPIAGYTFTSYALVLLFWDCIVAILGEVLLLDRLTYKKDVADKMFNSPLFVLISIVSAITIVLVANFVLSFFIQETLARAVVITIGVGVISNTYSGSSLARATIIEMPGVFFAIAAFSVLGFVPSIALMCIFHIAHYVPSYIKAHQEAF